MSQSMGELAVKLVLGLVLLAVLLVYLNGGHLYLKAAWKVWHEDREMKWMYRALELAQEPRRITIRNGHVITRRSDHCAFHGCTVHAPWEGITSRCQFPYTEAKDCPCQIILKT